jgi:radical SAM family uncharacterized protein
MVQKNGKSPQSFFESEIGTIRKSSHTRIRIALVYPNRYHLGMSNLGFQATYQLFNQIEEVACERSFLPENKTSVRGRLTTVESGKPLADFDIVAFSISFENDYPNILKILENSGLPLRSSDRRAPHPLVVAGGVTCFLNPEPLAPFIDCFLIGEAEAMVEQFSKCLVERDYSSQVGRNECLKAISQTVPGAYIPAFYNTSYHPDGTISAFEPLIDVPQTIQRTFLEDLSRVSTCSGIVSPDTTFERAFLIEVGRGCPHGCRFCSAGFIYRPPRFRPVALLQECFQQGMTMTDKIGLVGTAVSDLPGIKELCDGFLQKNVNISFSSLRADALDPELVSVLRRSKIKTATIAPDAGSERMRRVINKGITEEDVFHAVENLVESEILNLKLYFMVGLPSETMDDVEDIIHFCKKIKHRFLKSSRPKKRIGEITISLNCFVPKPFTPFQWVAMDDIPTLKKKIKKIKDGLRKVANLRVHADVPRWAYIQALLSRGDRKVADILSLAHGNRQNWPQTLKATPLNSDFYVLRERSLDELLPWDFIDHGIKKSFLAQEYKRAQQAKTSAPCPMESCDICGVCSANIRASSPPK